MSLGRSNRLTGMDTADVLPGRLGVTIDDAKAIAATLPRSYEALVRDQVKFRVGQLVYAAFSRDETIMGFGFPREEREALVASEPDKFLMPRLSDMRYRWVCVRLDAIDVDELRELLVDARHRSGTHGLRGRQRPKPSCPLRGRSLDKKRSVRDAVMRRPRPAHGGHSQEPA